jgi:excisionase family DNA binding protein
MEKLLMSKKEAAEVLGVSVRTIENMIARKQLVSRRLGKRRMIPCAALTQLAKRDTLVITGAGPLSDGGITDGDNEAVR